MDHKASYEQRLVLYEVQNLLIAEIVSILSCR